MVCRELGFIGAVSATTNSHFGDVSGSFTYDDVQCDGTENSLDDCVHSYYINCQGQKGAGVICNPNLPTLGTLFRKKKFKGYPEEQNFGQNKGEQTL